jgi:hypothetical protein
MTFPNDTIRVMHYPSPKSERKPTQDGPRLLAGVAAPSGGRALERPEHELELAGERQVGLEPPHELGAGMGLNMTHQSTDVGSALHYQGQQTIE